MNPKLQSVLDEIKAKLLDSNIKKVYVGKTSNVDEREREHNRDEFNTFDIIATGTPIKVNQAEKDLIEGLRFDITIRSKLVNENEGGGGSDNADKLYIVTEWKSKNRFDDLVITSILSNINTVEL